MGFLVHVDLVVTELDRSIEFYTQQLGLTLVETASLRGALPESFAGKGAESIEIAFLTFPDHEPGYAMLELMEIRPPGVFPLSHAWGNISVLSHDIDAALVTMRQNGVEVVLESTRVELAALGAAYVALVADPDGHRVELVQPV